MEFKFTRKKYTDPIPEDQLEEVIRGSFKKVNDPDVVFAAKVILHAIYDGFRKKDVSYFRGEVFKKHLDLLGLDKDAILPIVQKYFDSLPKEPEHVVANRIYCLRYNSHRSAPFIAIALGMSAEDVKYYIQKYNIPDARYGKQRKGRIKCG